MILARPGMISALLGHRWPDSIGFEDITGPRGTPVMFICNHCPYVQSIIDRIVRDAAQMQRAGIGVVAISAHDVADYPQDGPQQMKTEAARHGFTFPYLYDETQDVAKAYGAECTPISLAITRMVNCNIAAASTPRPEAPDLRMRGPSCCKRCCALRKPVKDQKNQIPSMGCSIKWKTA